ncbi:calcium/proton exchanger [Alicyclobacillus sp. SO9]|uniref:calcium/proton exchanger n=1 Tax=Alicyclobacillus sp. SO9 TaxID=2665646 RepID=UPI0018E89C24|nr:calcium/proton exchanger [Alicyclobacillus sp. SO9]QQE77046.1 calcium/proton exchanger [Alicyclobacillus sp. SO9]
MGRWVWPLVVLLLALSALIKWSGGGATLVFISSGLAIVPMAAVMGRSTEAIAAHAGSRVGGLVSATFGNAVELIIGAIALQHGYLPLVKASVTGSILGNLLLVLGLSFVVGGIRHPIQRFNIRAARSNASMLVLGVGLAFVFPAIFIRGSSHSPDVSIYIAAALVSFIVYMLGLLFSLFTHRDLFHSIEQLSTDEQESPPWRLLPAVGVLLVTTLLVGIESEWLVQSIEVAGSHLHWSELFTGVVVIALIGNAAEHMSAVLMAWKNRMDLSMEIAVGSSLQVAMFVAPVLFAISYFFHHPMPLSFSLPELAAMGGAVTLTAVLLMDGESNWLEGTLAVGAYIVMAVGFFTL